MNKISSCNQDYVPDRVSVIIPTYNYADYLPYAIDSALRQTVADIEIVVVDDGSRDNTRQVLRPYRYRIKYLYQGNRGLSAARNTGIQHSTGGFVQFLDADDMLGSDTINSHLQFLRNNPDVSISVCRNNLFHTTNLKGRPKINGEWHLFRNSLVVHLCHLNIAPPHAFFSRREAIIRTGRFDPTLKACEDWEYWLRAATQGHVFGYNPGGVVYYRRHADSMSSNAHRQLYFDTILHHRLSDLFDQYPDFPAGNRLEALLAFCAGSIYTAGKLKIYHPKLVNELLNLALNRSIEAREISVRSSHSWNLLNKLNYTRIISRLMYPFFHQSKIAAEIIKNLDYILAAVAAPQQKLKFFGNLLITTFSGSNSCNVQKKTLRGLLGRMSKNQVLKYLARWQLYKPKSRLSTRNHIS